MLLHINIAQVEPGILSAPSHVATNCYLSDLVGNSSRISAIVFFPPLLISEDRYKQRRPVCIVLAVVEFLVTIEFSLPFELKIYLFSK